VEEKSPEEVLDHLPTELRDMVAHLRVGLLSLPGVMERGAYDPDKDDYSIVFTVGDETLLTTHSAGGLWATVELTAKDIKALMERPDLPGMELEVRAGGGRRTLKELVEAERPEAERLVLDIVAGTQGDLRSLIRLAHAKYDAVMAR
jgi:hypothetical protein